MKKLLTLILVLTGMVSTASATQTIYLIPDKWDVSDVTEKFGAWVCESSGSDTDQWIAFSDSGLGFWYATFEGSYTKIVLGRFSNGATISGSTFSIDGLWTQSEDISYNSATPVYTCTKLNNSDSGVSATALYKLYVKDMDDTSNTAVNLDSWNRGNSYFTWPGKALGTETIDEVVWNVFYWPLNSIGATFTKNESGEDSWHYWATGGVTFDLSTTNYYYYYPTLHEFVLEDDALAEATTIHFRTNVDDEDFDTSKFYFWNNDGINSSYCFSDETINGYKWKTITTHKPTFSIQFYAGDGGNDDGTKTDKTAVTCVSGEEAYYVYRLSWGNNSKLDNKYYVISTDDANGGDNYLAKLEMESQGNFVYKATIDNVTATNNHFFEIAPVSALKADKTINDYGALIYSTNWDYSGPVKNPYAFTTFEEQSVATMRGKGYNRWKVSLPLKYDIYYNFATASMTIEPYFEREISSNGYATFSSDYDVTIPDGVTAYYASSAKVGSVTMTSLSNGIPSDQGAFLKANNGTGGTYQFRPATSTDSGTNLLVKGTDSGVTASNGSDSFNYVFALQGGQLGFYNVATDISSDMTGKAYLQTTSDIKPDGDARISIIFDDENTTAIKQIETTKQTVNGYYNIAGQRVAQPTKGLYIVNGKKVIMK